MRLIVGNIETKAVAGGKDNLLPFDVMHELRVYLRIHPENYHRADKFKEGKWDGYRYFITPSGKFATGFLPFVINFLEDNGVEVILEDARGPIPEFPELESYVGNIDGEDWECRDYQMDVAKAVNNYITLKDGTRFYHPRGILDCATNAGKNTITAVLAKGYDTETIFMVSSVTIYKQAVEFFSQVLGYKVGEVKSGKFDPKKFTVCMVKSLHSLASKNLNVKAWLATRKLLLVDESDESGASIYSSVLQLIPAPIRIFVSGTPLEAKRVNNMVSIGLSGVILAKVTNKYLFDNKYSQKPKVIVQLNSPKNLKPIMSYSEEVEKIVQYSEKKMRDILDIIKKHEGESILITFSEIEHGETIKTAIAHYLPEVSVGLVHGTSPDRDEQITNFKKGITQVLVGSMILKKGANIPNIRVLVRAEGGKSVITTKQVSGRATRHDGIHDDVTIYDWYDDGKYVGEHSRKRIATYLKEDFDVEYLYERRYNKPIK